MDITGLEYFMAHAPAEPQPWFQPVMSTERPDPIFDDEVSRLENDPVNYSEIREWEKEKKKQRYIQWPRAWAEEMIKQL